MFFFFVFCESDVEKASFSLRKELIQTENRQECLSALEEIFSDAPGTEGDFIAINFFALVVRKEKIFHILPF